jgi:hypothetical protein
MTDEQLIQKANSTPYIEWSSISSLIDLASNEETKRVLEQIQKYKFREEEFANGSL